MDHNPCRGNCLCRKLSLPLHRWRQSAEEGAANDSIPKQFVAALCIDVASGANAPQAPATKSAQQDKVTAVAAVIDDVPVRPSGNRVVGTLQEPASFTGRKLDRPRRVRIVEIGNAGIEQEPGASEPFDG